MGLDYEKDQVEVLRREGFNVVCADATNFDLDERFDLIVAGEIIEHLTCPGKLLECARRHLAPRGKLALTCPNANNILYFLENCLMGREQDNADHTCLFSPTTMSVLLHKCGYRAVSFHFVAENLAYYKLAGSQSGGVCNVVRAGGSRGFPTLPVQELHHGSGAYGGTRNG